MVKIQGDFQPDILEVNGDAPTTNFGSRIENGDEEVPPFYIILNLHDMVMHNAMMDSRESHNLMPKGMVECLG